MNLGILSDAHGNLGGFEAACRALSAEKADRCIYLGDAVGYIPDISVVHAIVERGLSWVAGNHEIMLIEGGYPSDREATYRLAEIREKLSQADADAIQRLPRSLRLELDGTSCLFVHGSPQDPTWGYVYPDTDLERFAGLPFDAVFMGHTHRPFVREHEGTLFVNVGSCGLPRDRSGMGSACLFDTVTRQARLLSFSLAAASRAVLADFVLPPAIRRLLERSIERD
jgi:putative phosphoesterase